MLWERLRTAGLQRGLAGLGVCDVVPFDEVRATIEHRKRTGLSADLTFTYNDPRRSTDIAVSFPWARRLVVAAHGYLPEAGDPGNESPGSGRVARFATEDHYVPLRTALDDLADLIRSDGWRAEPISDDNRLVDRAAAVRAGVGWWGKNTMVLAPRVGPWMLLGAVVTDADIEPTPAMVRDCGTCEACLPACPTGALIAPGVLDARRCLAHLLQAPGSFPIELRPAVGDRIYGCDDCLDVCPPGLRLLESSTARVGRVDLEEALALSDDDLLQRFEHFYVPRRRPAYLRRNMLIALGNTGGFKSVSTVATYVTHLDPLLRAHAAWALGRIGGSVARRHLTAALAAETDPEVIDEIEAALGDA